MNIDRLIFLLKTFILGEINKIVHTHVCIYDIYTHDAYNIYTIYPYIYVLKLQHVVKENSVSEEKEEREG